MMIRTLCLAMSAMLCLGPLSSQAVTERNFLINTTQDLVDLCAASKNDTLYPAAANFCHGYFLGAYQHYAAMTAQPGMRPFVCFPNPPPSRTAVIQKYVQWARAHPNYRDENAAESLFKFLTENWECQRR